jgi:uncharacterized protein YeaO (DUF488 family)
MYLKTKRWNDPVEPDDGYRVLICRLRPRGVAKARETWHEWCQAVAPSLPLLQAFQGKRGASLSWPEYEQRYLAEMAAQHEAIAALAARVRSGRPVTLLCASTCTDPERCHRTLLARLIERELEGS